VLSSIKGKVEAIGKEDVSLAASARAIAEKLGVQTHPVVVSNACISGLAALVQGMRMIRSGLADHVIVVGAEVQSPFIVTGFQSLKARSLNACRPFAQERDGLNLGEAAAALVLSKEPGRWELVEGAIRNDANHISGPSRTGEGSYNALRAVLSHCRREELAFVNVHGTATRYNDEMESIAIERAGLPDVPVNALKGIFGHTMGAAGILESIVSMEACDAGVVLPTKGFSTLGVSRPVKVSAEEKACRGREFIKLLSGFGGVNGALLFRKGGAR
jgi:3-oxoacyl-[acyl-carrier-protein] synthase-1